jgi:hypothetical protein
MIESQYLRLQLREPDDPRAKTKRYFVRSREDETLLGEIRWHSPWRRYSFHPAPGTLFDAQCLGDVQTWLTELMAERR